MLKNYVLIALRNIKRQWIFSFINITGLALGLASVIMILFWVQDELSYDEFHSNHENIYRVNTEWKKDGLYALTPGLLVPEAKDKIPEVVNAARILRDQRTTLQHGENVFYEDGILNADPELFEMFSFEILQGSPESLQRGFIITKDIAEKYFGEENAVGKRLKVNHQYESEVAGIAKNIPHNSSIQFDIISQLETLKKYWPNGFNWNNFVHESYVQLDPSADAGLVATKLTEMYFDHNPEGRQFVKKLHLQPLKKVYLASNVGNSQFPQGDQAYVYIFSFVALFVLIIACINFINLSTVRSLGRVREVGMRKVIGSSRKQLIQQFLGESIILAFLAALISIGIVESLLPFFNDLTGKQLEIDVFDRSLLISFVTIIVVTGIVAGSYPAFYLSSFHPLAILKGGGQLNLIKTSKPRTLRKGLVILQFTLSVALLVVTIFISRQMQYISHKKLGFEKENIVYVRAKGSFSKEYELVKNKLLQESHIVDVTAKGSTPAQTINRSYFQWSTMPQGWDFPVSRHAIDYNYIDFLGMNIVNGRSFSRELNDRAGNAYVVNEEAVKLMALESPVGEKISLGASEGTIIGVVENAHYKSLKKKIEPRVYHLMPENYESAMDRFGIVMIKLNEKDIAGGMKNIETIWKEMNPGYPYEYHFLSQTYDEMYKKDQQANTLMQVFTLLGIVVSCLGLFGLVTFLAKSRTKEIGIRKVMGASIKNIFILVSREFIILVSLAILIAAPAGYYFVNRWLDNFAYKIDIAIWPFFIAGVEALLIALLTLSWQTVRIAMTDPADALRDE